MFFRWKRRERRFESEIQYHLDRTVESRIAQGMDPREAARLARLEFGGVTQIREDLRDVHRPRWLADLRQDLVYAARTLRRSPGFLACAVLTLALGIGANTAIFSLIDAVMLRPLPAVRNASELVQIARITEGCNTCAVSYPLFEYFRDRLSSISGSFLAMPVVHEIAIDGVEEFAGGDLVSGDYYSVLGLTPAAGRLLGPEDDAAPIPVAVITYAYWARRFALDPAAIGKRILYGATEVTIVGVEPPGFDGTERGRARDFAAPLSMSDRLGGGNGEWRRQWDNSYLPMMARLKSGVPLAQANAEAAALFDAWRSEKAATLSGPSHRRLMSERAAALPGAAGLNGLRLRFLQPLAILMGIVALVLLLACANLSGLMLARASSRQREISVRRALGAGRSRLARQFLAESLLLAMAGAIAGVALAQWFCRVLVAMMANGGQLDLAVAPDWRVLVFTAVISLATCVFAGLAPGLSAGRAGVNPALKEVRIGGHRGLGRALVVAQLSISMTLVVGASLFIRTLVKLYREDSGVHTGGVFAFAVTSKHHFPRVRSVEIQTAIVDRLKALPGVVQAGAAVDMPLSGGVWKQRIQPDGYTFRPDEDQDIAFNAVTGGYFRITGTPILLGRDFSERDTAASLPVAIVNQAFVRDFFAGKAPLGRHVTANHLAYEIVGVVKDAKYESLRKAVPRTMYVPWLQQGEMGLSNRSQPMGYWYLARVAGGDPLRLAAVMERAVPEIDRAMRLRAPRTFEQMASHTMLKERMMATLGGFFGLLALMVACLGIFGIMAFQVSRRTNEIGVRMALGASRGDIVTLVMREVAMLLLPGCAAGAIAAAFLARFADSMLFGISATDPTAFALAACALAVSTLAAGYLPALRAARVEPISALRCD